MLQDRRATGIGEGNILIPYLLMDALQEPAHVFDMAFHDKLHHAVTRGPDRHQLSNDIRQGNEGIGQLIDHADGDEKASRGKVACQYQPRCEDEYNKVGQIRYERGDQL